jgi:pimeloyl-ACP methyl ester carboxylesterase
MPLPRPAQLVSLLVLAAIPAWSIAADDVTSDTFEASGVKVHYLVQGKGEPVVLIHGLYSSADINWQKPGIMAALAKDHQVIALDMPGHGASDKPEKDEAYGQQMADDVVLLLDHLKVKKAHVVGYSMGGIVALKVIADHPERVISGTLGGMGWLKDGSGLQKVWDMLPAREGARTPAACTKNMGKLAISEDALKAIKTPTIILVGDRDPVKKLYVNPLLKVRDDWKVIEIADAGHINCIAKKDFTDEMAKWIGKNSLK